MVLLNIFVVAQTKSNKIIGHSLEETGKLSWVVSPSGDTAQTRSNITIGDSLVAAQTTSNNYSSWVVSPLGDFAFGFLPLEDTSHFLLCIWYAKIPEKTVVWYANGDTPAPKGSKVELTAGDGLVITAPNGEKLWKTESLNGKVALGFLKDTGNFMLVDENHEGVWETFKDPRDTLLPSQTLQKGERLSSRFLESNFSKGRYEMLLQMDGILSIHALNSPSEYANENYYETRTEESNASSPGIQLVFEPSGYVYVLRKNNEKFNLSTWSGASTNESYFRATLNFDGVFTLYQHAKSSSGSDGWSPIWSQPDNICLSRLSTEGSGVCGFNSVCTLGNDQRPICQCPKWYSLVDPNDPHGSCKPDFIQGCAEDEFIRRKEDVVEYDFEVLINTDWPLSDYVLLKPFTEEQCRQSCLEDCMCAVIIFKSGNSCFKKKLPLSNGRVDAGLNGAKTFIKVRIDNSSLVVPEAKVNENSKSTLRLVAWVLFGGSLFLNVMFIGALCMSFFFIFKYKKKLGSIGKSDNALETNLRCFSYEELERATNGFQKELGRGSFGVVYEGVINIGSAIPIAVKKLNSLLLQQVEKEFKNELHVIGLTHHKNLVRLIGYCEAEAERLLVYEYMSNGTLASLLFNEVKPDWKLRLEIAFGVARGLAYLHEECITQIIHCDIKPQNILLDEYHNARISDFGLAKLLKMNQSRTNTAIRGTKGYVALEWFKNMPITAKVDVYSYGVLLLEIICCRRNVEMDLEEEEKAILTDWACDCYSRGAFDALVKDDKEALDDKKNMEKLVMITIWCVQEDPTLRPTMRKVTQMLEGVVEVLPPPWPSQFSRHSQNQ
ncbi:G-type lectin S-receptor-like serine/threonine-protein kinase RLK1, partial [Mucuna pruriens]